MENMENMENVNNQYLQNPNQNLQLKGTDKRRIKKLTRVRLDYVTILNRILKLNFKFDFNNLSWLFKSTVKI